MWKIRSLTRREKPQRDEGGLGEKQHMSGIAGFTDIDRRQEAAVELIDRMGRMMWHRGPDDQGTQVVVCLELWLRTCLDPAYTAPSQNAPLPAVTVP
jgi:hypothetical protein